VCVGDNVEFLNSTTGASYYLWDFGDGNTSTEFQPEHQYAAGGQYTVQLVGYDNELCITADTVEVEITIVPDVFPEIQNDVTICSGETTQLFADGSANLHWLYDITLSDINVQNPIAQPSVTTTYYVVDENECDAETLSVVVEVSSIDVNASNDTSLCIGQSAVLFASGGLIYEWSPIDFLNNPNIANPTSSPTENIDYTVTATNEDGCSDEQLVSIVVFNETPGGQIYQPLTVCEGDQVQLQAESANAWSWSLEPDMTACSSM